MPEVDDILHIPLERFTHEAAEALYQLLGSLLGSQDRDILHDVNLETSAPDDFFDNSLADTAFELILSQVTPLRDDNRAGGFLRPFRDPETTFQAILAHLWYTVVRPILNGLAFSVRSFNPEMMSSVDNVLFYRMTRQSMSCLVCGGI
jgi:hypothetical protein